MEWKQTRRGPNARLTAVSGTRRHVNGNEQRSSNERATAPQSVSATNDLGHMKTNRIWDRRPALWNIYAQGRGLADGRARVAAAPQMMAVFCVGSGSSEREECAAKQQLLAVAVCFVCVRWTGAAQQLQEAFIMSLVKGGKSQYSENKNGFETGGPSNNVQQSQTQLGCKASCSSLFASVSVSISSAVHSIRGL